MNPKPPYRFRQDKLIIEAVRQDDAYPGLPWIAQAERPRKRDAWKVLRGTYRPAIGVSRPGWDAAWLARKER